MSLKSLDEIVMDVSEDTDLSRDTVTEWLTDVTTGEYVVVDRYWIEAPFLFVEIHHHPETDDYQYNIHRPGFLYDDAMRETTDTLKDAVNIDSEDLRSESYANLVALLQPLSSVVSDVGDLTVAEAYEAAYMVKHTSHPLRSLRGMVADSDVARVDCSGPDAKIRVKHREHGDMMTNITISESGINDVITRVREAVNHTDDREHAVQLNEKTVFAWYEDVGDSVSFSIESYDRGNVSPVELLQSGMFSAAEMAYLWEVTTHGVNTAVIGGTGAGKSVTLNAIGNFIPMNTRIISIEDKRELELHHPYWTPQTFIEDVSSEEILKNALRAHPNRLLLDSLRGTDAEPLFQAATTGHVISFAMHATSVDELTTRLQNDPINVPETHLSQLDIVITTTRHSNDGDAINRCSEITEFDAEWSGSATDLQTTTVASWKADTDTHEYCFDETGGSVSELGDDSRVIHDIAETELRDADDIISRIETRRDVLSYMVDNDLDGVAAITAVVEAFDSDVNEQLTAGDLKVGEWISQAISEEPNNTE